MISRSRPSWGASKLAQRHKSRWPNLLLCCRIPPHALCPSEGLAGKGRFLSTVPHIAALKNITTMPYKKHFIPLESNPDVFTGLMHDLGVSNRLKFVDVWSIDDPDQLAVVPHPVLALILVLPSSDTYEQKTSAEESNREAYSGNGDEEGVMWLKQTINNACGLYAPLHALCNMNRVFVGE